MRELQSVLFETRSRGERGMSMGFAAPGGPDGPIPAPAARAESPVADGCTIKGNISRKGERVYHLLGSRDYDRTRIDAKTGERMFCSEERRRRAAGERRADEVIAVTKVPTIRQRRRTFPTAKAREMRRENAAFLAATVLYWAFVDAALTRAFQLW